MSRARVNWRRIQMALVGVRHAQRKLDAIKVRGGEGDGAAAAGCEALASWRVRYAGCTLPGLRAAWLLAVPWPPEPVPCVAPQAWREPRESLAAMAGICLLCFLPRLAIPALLLWLAASTLAAQPGEIGALLGGPSWGGRTCS